MGIKKFIVIVILILSMLGTASGIVYAHLNLVEMCAFFKEYELFAYEREGKQLAVTVFDQTYKTKLP